MEIVTSKINFEKNPYIVDIIMKYKLYSQIKIEPVFIKVYGKSYPVPNCFKPFEINARISKEDFDKIKIGDFIDDVVINDLKIPHMCSVKGCNWSDGYDLYEINLSFFV